MSARLEMLEILRQTRDRCVSFIEYADKIIATDGSKRVDFVDCRRESSLLSRNLVDWRNAYVEMTCPGSIDRREERRKRYLKNVYASGELERNDPEERKAFYERLNTWARGLGR
jgi:hypothetical protein